MVFRMVDRNAIKAPLVPTASRNFREQFNVMAALIVLLSSMTWTSQTIVAEEPQTLYGTIGGVDASGVISLIPWGKKPTDAKAISTGADTAITIALSPAKATDLKEGMWIKIQELSPDGKAKRLIAGDFLIEEGDKIIIFKGMPEEFLLYRSEGWYTNTAGGIRFKIQPMGAGKTPTNPGTNLRAASYKEPAGGFVVYFPLTLKGAILNWGGAKAGANKPDEEGKVLVNKETCTEYYWKHLKNPARPEAGYVSGMTEFTIRKLPARP